MGPASITLAPFTVAAMGLAIAFDEAITWGDILLVLGVLALIAFVISYLPRRRG
jgi:hypothetical protein